MQTLFVVGHVFVLMLGMGVLFAVVVGLFALFIDHIQMYWREQALEKYTKLAQRFLSSKGLMESSLSEAECAARMLVAHKLGEFYMMYHKSWRKADICAEADRTIGNVEDICDDYNLSHEYCTVVEHEVVRCAVQVEGRRKNYRELASWLRDREWQSAPTESEKTED